MQRDFPRVHDNSMKCVTRYIGLTARRAPAFNFYVFVAPRIALPCACTVQRAM
jgi:hypothetical protein